MAEHQFARRDAHKAEILGARLGRLAFRVLAKHRARALQNLELAMPEVDEAERLKIVRGVFEHFGRVAGDFMHSPVRTAEETIQSIEVEENPAWREAQALGKGIIAVTGHFGNWERLAHWVSVTGGSITVVARDANDAGMQARVQRIRAKSGVEVLSRGKSTRALIRKLREGGVIGVLPDQNSDESYLPFFGKPAGTVLGPAKLHLMTGAPIVPTFCPRIGPVQYRLIVGEPIMASANTTAEDLMTEVNLALEKVVRQYPDQWLWIHDRWKSARRKGLL